MPFQKGLSGGPFSVVQKSPPVSDDIGGLFYEDKI